MLKLLLVASAYASIVQVIRDMKRDSRSVSTETHRSATQLQTTLEQIIPMAEQKLKNASTNLAKQHYELVCVCVCVCVCACKSLCVHIKASR